MKALDSSFIIAKAIKSASKANGLDSSFYLVLLYCDFVFDFILRNLSQYQARSDNGSSRH